VVSLSNIYNSCNFRHNELVTKKQRRNLFAWALVFFVLLSAAVLSFAFGFRYDFENSRLVKTGSMVLKPNMEAQIFIDGKLEGQTSFLKSSFSKKRLLPGTYSVKVQKERFAPWEKEVEVKEGLVSNLSRIVLFNQDQTKREIIGRSNPISLSRELEKIVYGEKNALVFYDFDGNLIYKSKAVSLDLTKTKIIWGDKGKEVLAYDQFKVVYFDLAKNVSRELNLPKPHFLETAVLRDGRLYFLNSFSKPFGSKDLTVFSIEKLNGKVLSKNISAFFVNQEGTFLAFSGSPYRLFKIGLNGENMKILGNFKTAGMIKNTLLYNNTDFILAGTDLYSFLPDRENKLILMAKGVKNFSVSPDGFMLGWHTDREFWVEWLKDTEFQPLKKTGERELILKMTENIRGFSWYKNSNYSFLELDSGLVAVEVDSRGAANKYKLLDLADQEQAWYDLERNKIFKLSNFDGLAIVEMP